MQYYDGNMHTHTPYKAHPCNAMQRELFNTYQFCESPFSPNRPRISGRRVVILGNYYRCLIACKYLWHRVGINVIPTAVALCSLSKI